MADPRDHAGPTPRALLARRAHAFNGQTLATARQELDALPATVAALPDPPGTALRGIPTVVLSAEQGPLPAAHRALATTADADFHVVSGATHFIHYDNPAHVVNAVTHVIDATAARRAASASRRPA